MAPRPPLIEISSDSNQDSSDFSSHDESEQDVWVATMTESKCSGRQALGVPAWVRELWFADKRQQMLVQYSGEPFLQCWDLFWHDGNLLIGRGWYAFCKERRPSVGDTVTFMRNDVNNIIRVRLDRA
ncbi:DNA-binding barrel domain superfamily [Sesbania bispinosa]|nr:DNA-binding barrel domain superfamily [Sesbania bispinosa]